MDLKLRSDVMQAKDSNILYLARNLVCTGSNYFDTGFAPFSSENINKDFKITIRFNSITFKNKQDVFLGCKYEGKLNNLDYPGIYIRRRNTYNDIEIGGYNYYNPALNVVLNHNVQIWRSGTTWKAIIDGQTERTLSVRSTTFNQNILLGAGEQTNGVKFRNGTCNIDYVRIEYI